MLRATVFVFLAIIACTLNGLPCEEKTPVSSSEPTSEYSTQHDVFQSTQNIYVTQVSVIQQSCKHQDIETVETSVSSLHTSVLKITKVVKSPSFDSRSAVIHRQTVATVITAYVAILDTIESYPAIRRGCKDKLDNISSCVKEVITVFSKFNISLKEDIETSGGANSDQLFDSAVQYGSSHPAAMEETSYADKNDSSSSSNVKNETSNQGDGEETSYSKDQVERSDQDENQK